MAATYTAYDGVTYSVTGQLIFLAAWGDNNNDGLTRENPKYSAEVNTGNVYNIYVLLKGEHHYTSPIFIEPSGGSYIQNSYFLAERGGTKLNLTYPAPTWSGVGISLYFKEIKGISFSGNPRGYIGSYAFTGGENIYNCAFDFRELTQAPYWWIYDGYFRNCTFIIGDVSIMGYVRMPKCYNCAVELRGTGDFDWQYSNGAGNLNNLSITYSWQFADFSVDDNSRLVPKALNDTYGVYCGQALWKGAKYFVKSGGSGSIFTIVPGALAVVLAVVDDVETADGIEEFTPEVLALIRQLVNPQLVSIREEAKLEYQALRIDDIELLTPTGDIQLKWVKRVVRFLADDVGEVRRLLSVDGGNTWLTYDRGMGGLVPYLGSLTDKEEMFNGGLDTEALNGLTEGEIGAMLPVEGENKRVRFLTLIRQQSLGAAKSTTKSISIDCEREGYYVSIPFSQFEEQVSDNLVRLKYVGTETIEELKLVLM